MIPGLAPARLYYQTFSACMEIAYSARFVPSGAGHASRRRKTAVKGNQATVVSALIFLVCFAGYARAGADPRSATEMLVDFMKMGSDEWQRRAEQMFRQGDLKEALRAAQEAARLRPGSAYLHRLLGYLHAALGEHKEARAEFERAAAIDPRMRVNLADFYLAQALNEL